MWMSRPPGVAIFPLGGVDVRRRADDHVDAVHRVGVAGLADAGDLAAADADVGGDDPQDRVQHERVGQHPVERALRLCRAG